MSRMTRSPMRDAAPTHDSARPHDAGVVSTSPRARRLSRMLAILIVGAVCLGAVSIASATTVTLPGAPRDGWAVYHVPVLTGRPAPCCHGYGSGRGKGICDLDRDQGFSISDRDPDSKSGDLLAVYLHFAAGRIDDVRALGERCPVVQADTVQALADVAPATSIALLRELADDTDKAGDNALGALAYHADAAATGAMIALAGEGQPRERRKSALFWLGETRGADGAAAIERVLREDADDELRREAVFALSRSDAIDVHAALLRLAREDRDNEVRAQALFWMGQHGDKRARADLVAVVLDPRASEHVRDQGVFALSQLKPDGIDGLVDLVRGDAPREVKKKAMFWLGQSDSDKATKLLDEVLANAER